MLWLCLERKEKAHKQGQIPARCLVWMNKTILSTALTILLIRWVCQFSGKLQLFYSIFGGVCMLRLGCAKNEGICSLFAVALDLVPCPGLLFSLRWDLCLGSAGHSCSLRFVSFWCLHWEDSACSLETETAEVPWHTLDVNPPGFPSCLSGAPLKPLRAWVLLQHF